jgi:acetyl-CoA C-acetyltransferase
MTTQTLNPNTPILIGVGEYSERLDDSNYQALSPVQLAVRAANAACDDALSKAALADHIDAIASVRTFEDTSPKLAGPFGKANCFPRAIAKHVGIEPKVAIWEVGGGQSPQHLVSEFCEKLAAGDISMGLLVGAEAISTTRFLASQQKEVDWSETVDGDVEDRGPGSDGLSTPYMQKHMLYAAPQAYALLEHARRARLGLKPQEYARQMGELFAPFTSVAAENPHSMSRETFSAAELIDVTEKNRVIADPYPRRLVARDQVNQSAALLLTTVAKAEALNIDASKWVFLHGYADVAEKGYMKREDLGASPAALMASQQALKAAGIGISDVDAMDLYSCFPIAVSNICDGLGLAADDPRGLTAVGGLPFFGGAGNNYSMHAVVSVAQKLRQKPGSYGFVGANGGFMSKYSVGVYSTSPRNFTAGDNQSLQNAVDQLPSPTVTETPDGEATIETYTVVYHKGAPAFAIVIGRLKATNERFLAMNRKEEPETLKTLLGEEPIGKTIFVTSAADANRFAF